MGKLVFAVILTALLPITAFGAEPKIKKGDSINVDAIYKAEVKNLEVIRNKTREFSYGDMCHFKQDGTLTVIALSGDSLLVRYSADQEVDGSLCPNGVILFYPKNKFIEATEEQKRRIDETLKEKELIKKLLGR
ncbi:MAG: hypothetical protein AAB527_01720 [Patescibacteria group bacterium]